MQSDCPRCGDALIFRLPFTVPDGARTVDVDHLIAEHDCKAKRFRVTTRGRRR